MHAFSLTYSVEARGLFLIFVLLFDGGLGVFQAFVFIFDLNPSVRFCPLQNVHQVYFGDLLSQTPFVNRTELIRNSS